MLVTEDALGQDAALQREGEIDSFKRVPGTWPDRGEQGLGDAIWGQPHQEAEVEEILCRRPTFLLIGLIR